MKVRELVHPAKAWVAVNASLRDMLEQFRRQDMDHLPVVDAAQRVVGLVSPVDLLDYVFPKFYDLLRDYAALEDKGQLSSLFDAAFRGLDLEEDRLVLAADVMRSDWAWIGYDDSLLSAAARLFRQGAARLPVVDRDRRLVGILSQRDVVMALLTGQSVGVSK